MVRVVLERELQVLKNLLLDLNYTTTLNKDELKKSLVKVKIDYSWFGEAMGGYRKLNNKCQFLTFAKEPIG